MSLEGVSFKKKQPAKLATATLCRPFFGDTVRRAAGVPRRSWPASGRSPRHRETRPVRPPCFFFQAEDGLRDLTVTGVQTCALPIFPVLAIGGSLVARRDWGGLRRCALIPG